jgi:hypothetical protein
LEAVDPAEELGVGEDRFDDLLASPVERLSLGCVEDRFDPTGFITLPRCQLAWFAAFAVLGRDQDVDSSRADLADR